MCSLALHGAHEVRLVEAARFFDKLKFGEALEPLHGHTGSGRHVIHIHLGRGSLRCVFAARPQYCDTPG